MIFDGLATGLRKATEASGSTGASGQQGLRTFDDCPEMGDQRIAMRQRPMHRRDDIQRGSDIMDLIARDNPQAVIIEPA